MIFITLVEIAVNNVLKVSSVALLSSHHLIMSFEEYFHVALLQIVIAMALIDLRELLFAIGGSLLKFLHLIGCHNTGVTLKCTALQHQTHPFNKFIFHELEVIFLNWS